MQVCVKVASCPTVGLPQLALGICWWSSTLRTLTSLAVLLLLLLLLVLLLSLLLLLLLLLLQGAKYVIRTDVLYLNPPKQPAEGSRGKSNGKTGLGRK
jgi:hypothetical protein